MGTVKLNIAIAEIIIYFFLLPFSISLTYRHGVYRAFAFFYLCIFCSLRIAAAALGIASENNRENRENLVWSEILGSVGIGPLLLAGFHFLSRLNLNSEPRSLRRLRAIQALYLPHIVALALSIVGGVELSSYRPSPHTSGKQFAQAGISIFLVVFLLYVLLCLITAVTATVAPGEKCILFGVLAAIPFLFIRILYAMLAVSRDRGKFAILNGSATTQLGMAIIQEMVVVLVYIGVGILAPVEEKVQPVEEGQAMQRFSIARTL
ncbi:MAG: hypothetical protein Q9208_003327 [Pyrenodesmia sp. 3 TL-2023]